MGINGPRSPAVHRGAQILEAISSGAASTPAEVSAAVGLPKSSIADLLGTLEDIGFVTRGADGDLHAGRRWSSLSDPTAVAHRLFRACATTDLDGHTISVAQLFGNQIIFVDVHQGTQPLPLTPRPGQRADATTCAGSVAILSSMPRPAAIDAVTSFAAHLGLTDDDVESTLALRCSRKRRVYESDAASIGPQLACAVKGTRFALTLHLPGRLTTSARRKAAAALYAASVNY